MVAGARARRVERAEELDDVRVVQVPQRLNLAHDLAAMPAHSDRHEPGVAAHTARQGLGGTFQLQ